MRGKNPVPLMVLLVWLIEDADSAGVHGRRGELGVKKEANLSQKHAKDCNR